MSAMASQITSHTIVYWAVYSGADQKTPKRRVIGFCAENSLVISESTPHKHTQGDSNAKNVSIRWRHHIHTTSVFVKFYFSKTSTIAMYVA